MTRLLILCIVALLMGSCNGTALIKDRTTIDNINARLESRADWLPGIPKDIAPREAEALRFLYAYMQLADVADYDQSMILANIRSTMQSRDEMSWGATIPEDIFLHFVLPVRSSNETLDVSRPDFYAELKERVKDMSMYDAILEVNHWCHEKVVYASTDGRTCSPSATVLAAFGRCGEEAPFTVAAIRAVGIPARLIYTPRWGHTDDNHAWVEAWADGKWYYLGACEPEAALNAGWFTGPASRGLLMHSRVFGDYNGAEEVISRGDGITEINVTSNYAPVSRAVVVVKDTTGAIVPGANVTFSIYNYAELYPAVRHTADERGTTSLTAGNGMMVVWADNGSDYGYELFNFGSSDTLTVVLDKKDRNGYSVDLDIIPPAGAPGELTPIPVTGEQKAANARRTQREDSIRRAYIATFMDKDAAYKLAGEIGADGEQTWQFVSKSRGNWDQIAKFLRETPKDRLSVAFQLLGVISEKDLHDTPASVLTDHLDGAAQYADRPFFAEYILNPRIANEVLTPYRQEFSSVGACSVVDEVINFARGTKLRSELNSQNLAITPMGVHRMRMADMPALERYTIALIRSHGIPARREPITMRPQYYDLSDKRWVDIKLSDDAPAAAPRGTLDLKYTPVDLKDDDPQYYSRFTVAKLTGGRYKTIDMSSTVAADMGAGISFKNLFHRPLELEAGKYMLTTGTRIEDGTVLCKLDFFTIEPDEQTVHQMVLRRESRELKVLGRIDPAAQIVPEKSSAPRTLAQAAEKGYFILAVLEPKKEPTNHSMRDIAELRGRLDRWGGRVIIVLRGDEEFKMFDREEFGTLPAGTILATDFNGGTVAMLKDKLKLEDASNLPIILVANADGDVVFLSQGYTIGVGRRIMNVIRKTESK